MSGVRRLEPVFVERIWGRTDLSPLYGPQSKRIGEVWFPVGPDFPLLVKFIFTSEKLSVQVHPEDDFAREHENSPGKTEMWYILSADNGASIALGMSRPVTTEQLRSAIADGSVVNLLHWQSVKPGDTLLAPAGTIHAIGAGVMLCEIQQNSDITYRLFDYGRPRELHLEKGLAVSRTDVYNGDRKLPLQSQYFVTEMLDLARPLYTEMESDHLLITIEGSGTVAGMPFAPGECWFVPGGSRDILLRGEPGTKVLRTSAPVPQAA